eukprot:4750644-Heterocapsa_arctica.AAC.1
MGADSSAPGPFPLRGSLPERQWSRPREPDQPPLEASASLFLRALSSLRTDGCDWAPWPVDWRGCRLWFCRPLVPPALRIEIKLLRSRAELPWSLRVSMGFASC